MNTLSKIGANAAPAYPYVVQRLTDTNEVAQVQIAAARALGELGSEQAIGALRARSARLKENEPLNTACKSAIDKIQERQETSQNGK